MLRFAIPAVTIAAFTACGSSSRLFFGTVNANPDPSVMIEGVASEDTRTILSRSGAGVSYAYARVGASDFGLYLFVAGDPAELAITGTFNEDQLGDTPVSGSV